MNQELITIIEQLKNDFSYEDIFDYQNFLLIIYNSLFLDEDHLTSDIKYKIFETLSTIINNIQLQKETNNNIDKETNLNILKQVFIPYYLQNGEIRPRYRMYRHLVEKNQKHRKVLK